MAGGIGGLLAVTHHAGHLAGRTFWTVCDERGNVVALVDADATNHPVVASMEYGPFGELLAVDGLAGLDPYFNVNRSTLAELCPLLFSTKYLDAELAPSGGLYYYGYRYYDPTSGKWLSRDPLAEQGGLNLYAFKDPLNSVDPEGLRAVTIRIFYHWEKLKLTEGVKNEVNRILQQAVARFVAKDDQGKAKHTVSIEWIKTPLKSTAALKRHKEKGKFREGYPRQWGHESDRIVNVFCDDAYQSDGYGQSSSWGAGLNAGRIQRPEAIENTIRMNAEALKRLRGQIKRDLTVDGKYNPDKLIATVVAHEVFHHLIGDTTGWSLSLRPVVALVDLDWRWLNHHHLTSYVDAAEGRVGGILSKEAAKALCSELSID